MKRKTILEKMAETAVKEMKNQKAWLDLDGRENGLQWMIKSLTAI